MSSTEVVFSAVSGSARQLFLLLRCIQFTTKAHVSITENGLYFMVESARVMQGSVLIEKSLFSSYIFRSLPMKHRESQQATNIDSSDDDSNTADAYTFQINLPSFLETLQILGLSDPSFVRSGLSGFARDSLNSGVSAAITRGGPASAFNSGVLGTQGICRLSYNGPGSPLTVVLEEGIVTTTCTLTTYEPETDAGSADGGGGGGGDIPLRRDALTLKVIMRASLLASAVAELDGTGATTITLAVSPDTPNLTLSAAGPQASASVEFSLNKQLLETFQCAGSLANTYNFGLIRGAARAMAKASKVSMRADENGVLSLQVMIEGEGSGSASFVDFRFMALLDEESEV